MPATTNDIVCELCKKKITTQEAQEASEKLTNTGVVMCLACVEKALDPEKFSNAR